MNWTNRLSIRARMTAGLWVLCLALLALAVAGHAALAQQRRAVDAFVERDLATVNALAQPFMCSVVRQKRCCVH